MTIEKENQKDPILYIGQEIIDTFFSGLTFCQMGLLKTTE